MAQFGNTARGRKSNYRTEPELKGWCNLATQHKEWSATTANEWTATAASGLRVRAQALAKGLFRISACGGGNGVSGGGSDGNGVSAHARARAGGSVSDGGSGSISGSVSGGDNVSDGANSGGNVSDGGSGSISGSANGGVSSGASGGAAGGFAQPLLNRYQILREDWPAIPCDAKEDGGALVLAAEGHSLAISLADGSIALRGANGVETRALPEPTAEGFRLEIGLAPGDRLFGLGDESRNNINKRGQKADMWVQNVHCYTPIPFLMSSRGWGILVNTSYRHQYDLGCSREDAMVVEAREGPLDFYLFAAKDMPGMLDLYTQLSGRPMVLPKYAYGYMFICNQENDARAMLDDALRFRERGIPCDSIGLEPDWMETHYDYTVEKKWHPRKFYIPSWIRKAERNHPITFFGALDRLGFRLSLWLCCDYDLLWEEEKDSHAEKEAAAWTEEAFIADDHFMGEIHMDRQTVPGQPWFEHLKKFVDQGASAFKVDGANMILNHPDRLWAGRYRDSEVHNIMSLILGKQMNNGYAAHTGDRPMINMGAGYAGIQRYAATWAGDTGGGEKPLVSSLNLALCGVSNTSCDIEVTDMRCIHFGFLQAWTQQNNFDYWQQPWLMGDELEECFRFYARLRSRLFPYLYQYAHVAARTGMPMMRPLPLMWPDTDAYDGVTRQFMLGDALMVAAFTDEVVLPGGEWFDFWTEEKLAGGGAFPYSPPKGRGGGLFAKAGSVVATQDWAPSLERFVPGRYDLHVYPGGDFDAELIQDDGNTYKYLEGQVAATPIRLRRNADGSHSLAIGRRQGSYEGIAPLADMRVVFHGGAPAKIESGIGAALAAGSWEGLPTATVPALQHEAGDVAISWRY
jgi:alpha-glucosidase (family GH31 glycosyl hydrolase)